MLISDFLLQKKKPATLDSVLESYCQMIKMRFALLDRKNMIICKYPVVALTMGKI